MSSLFLLDPRLPDLDARLLALDSRQSFLVEAPAGSGKTGLLMQRYLKLLADESVVDPAQVIAITFTVKATAELRERVINELQAAKQGSDAASPFDRQTRELARDVLARTGTDGWNLLDEQHRLNIRTIDALCAQIANALPILSGGSISRMPVPDAGPLHREAARRTLMLLGGSDRALHEALAALLLHRDGNLSECEKLLAQMLSLRDQWLDLLPPGDHDDATLDRVIRPRFERALEMAICRTLSQLNELLPNHLRDELASLARQLSPNPGHDGGLSPLAICREMHSAPGQAAEDLERWRVLADMVVAPSTDNWRKPGGLLGRHVGFQLSKNEKRALAHLIEQLSAIPGLCHAFCSIGDLPPVSYPHDQWAMVKIVFRILRRAQEELQEVFSTHGRCDFVEVALLAKGALQEDEAGVGLRTAFGFSLQHLLVDEMQDTSTNQYELLRLLTRNWEGTSRTIFLVGDPKQSIYRFRQARVERFVRAIQDRKLGNINLTNLRLTSNFRSQPELVSSFNTHFTSILPGETDSAQPEEVSYSRVSAMRTDSNGSGLAWHPKVIERCGDAQTSARAVQLRSDAVEIRRIIKEWNAKPLPAGRLKPWSIVVLVRSRDHLSKLVEVLREGDNHGPIPFRAVDIDSLSERQEVLDALALTRALLHPADRVAWFAFLRAPWCGLTLADLHRLAGGDEEALAKRSLALLIEERGHELSDDGRARLARIWSVMQAAEAYRGQSNLCEWVERTWLSLGSGTAVTKDELTNVRRYFDLLAEIEQPGGRIDLGLLVHRLGKLYAATSLRPGAVELMTIHKAKGLEWDVVIVPELHRMPKSDGNRLLAWTEIDNGGDESIAPGVLSPIAGRGRENRELTKWIRSVDRARERAEQKRLFYVACSRAREELHLFAAPAQKVDGTLSIPTSTLLYSAWPAAKRAFEGARQPASASPILLDLAASAAPVSLSLPLSRSVGEVTSLPLRSVPGGQIDRSGGSFTARSFGNATHALLDLLTSLAKRGETRERLLEQVSTWNRRAATLLRSAGLSSDIANRLGLRIRDALSSTLQDQLGWWIIGPHGDDDSSEYAITSWNDGGRRSYRVDRMFRAGPQPLSEGKDLIWIVDYKTGSAGRNSVDEYLQREREKYTTQLDTYARDVTPNGSRVCLGLYHPLLARLTWWHR